MKQGMNNKAKSNDFGFSLLYSAQHDGQCFRSWKKSVCEGTENRNLVCLIPRQTQDRFATHVQLSSILDINLAYDKPRLGNAWY